MAGLPPPPPPSQWPPLQTPACYNKMLGMGADNSASQYSRTNSEIPSSTPLPTCEVGYSWPNGSHYQRVMPMSLPPYQAQIQHGTGVFHPSRVSTEYRRANYNSINGRRITQAGGHEDNGNCQNGGGENCSKGKEKKNGGLAEKKNDVWMKKENGSKVKKENKKKKKINEKKNGESEKKEEECHVPNLPPGIVLPMEWPYPDSF